MTKKDPPKKDDLSSFIESTRSLAKILNETGLTEIEVEQDGQRIRVSKNRQEAHITEIHASPPREEVHHLPSPERPSASPEENPVKASGISLNSPMVGTAYLSMEPGAPPFVTEGAFFKEGDPLLIVEAMKVMNPITAPKDGRVLQILIQNGQPVEFGTALLVFE